VQTYATDEGEPTMRPQLFLRLDWEDAFIRYLELGLVSFIDPFDRSTLAQLSAQYALSKHWTLEIYATGVFGGASTEKGAFPGRREKFSKLSGISEWSIAASLTRSVTGNFGFWANGTKGEVASEADRGSRQCNERGVTLHWRHSLM
jgi:hypothetical protein